MANKSFSRSQRVAQQLQRVLSELLRREVRDPRLGMVTITEVRMANDMSYARVFYSMLGGDATKVQDIMDSAAELLRGPAGRALGLRHAPELRFVADELIQSGARLSALINRAVKDDAVRHKDEPQDRSHQDTSDTQGHDDEPQNAGDAHEPGDGTAPIDDPKR
jgi:ribosome-binding factor A